MEGVGGGGGGGVVLLNSASQASVNYLTVRVVGDVRISVKVYENSGGSYAHGH